MYASRYKLKNLIIGGQPGGALATSHKVENYPWIISASGKEIMDNFKEHAKVSGSEILEEMVVSVVKYTKHHGGENHFHITTATTKRIQNNKNNFSNWK